VKEGLGFEGLSIGANSLNRVTAGLVGLSEKRYISRNLQVSYDRVLRVGPLGPALFYYLGPLCREMARAGSGSSAGT